MFGSTVIDIAIGLIFVYLLLSLICSAVNEIIERFARYRARDLERGLHELFRNGEWVHKVYNHPLIWGLFEGKYAPGAKNLPSYIPATTFALSVMDLILPGAGASGATRAASPTPGIVVNVAGVTPASDGGDPLEPLRTEIKKIENQHVQQALLTLVSAAGKDVAKARENIEGWFNSSMDRVSGWYKRRTQLIILVLGVVLAAALNADTIAIVRVLSTDRTMRESLVAAAEAYAKNPPTELSPPVTSGSPAVVPSPETTAEPIKTVSPARAGRARARATPATPVASSSPTVSPAAASPSTSEAAASIASAKPTPSASPECHTPQCRIKGNLEEIKKLGLPIGWSREVGDPRSIYISAQAWPVRIVGWLITAFACSLGAAFWFDLLNKFVVVRSTVKPREKSPEEPSKD